LQNIIYGRRWKLTPTKEPVMGTGWRLCFPKPPPSSSIALLGHYPPTAITHGPSALLVFSRKFRRPDSFRFADDKLRIAAILGCVQRTP